MMGSPTNRFPRIVSGIRKRTSISQSRFNHESSRLPTPGIGPARFGLRERMGEALHVNCAAFDFDAFARKELPLQACVWFRNEEASARADHAMPGNALTRGAGRHRVANHTS